MKRKLLLTLMIAAAGFTGCKKEDTDTAIKAPVDTVGNPGILPGGCYPPADCSTYVCTQQFVGVVLEVRDASGSAVIVDSFIVTNLSGVPLPRAASGLKLYGYPNTGNGQYTVLNDGWVQGHQNSSIQVFAKGFIKGVQVFNEPFTIVTDCCHVGKYAGKDVIILP